MVRAQFVNVHFPAGGDPDVVDVLFLDHWRQDLVMLTKDV